MAQITITVSASFFSQDQLGYMKIRKAKTCIHLTAESDTVK